jgi:hypothetical protein
MAAVIRRLAVLGILTVPVGAVACREKPSQDAIYQEKARSVVPQIEAGIGLKFKTPPKIEVHSKEEVRTYLEAQLKDSLAQQQVAGQEASLKRFGLIPQDLDLQKLLLDVLAEQVGGYYDPKTKVLYIIEDTPEEAVGFTVAHELIHALQDQYLNLDSVMRSGGDDDRILAAQAVLEGQATYEGLRISVGPEMADNLPGGWDRARQTIRDEKARWPAFASAPLIVQEMLLFPYLSGAEFARAYRAGRPGTTPFADMPTSSEQILHPPLYLARRDPPTRVTLPPLPGQTIVHQNSVGEFTTRLFLYEHLRDQQAAVSGAAGWDGDRFALVRTSRGEGVVWVSVWDSGIDAGDFYNLVDRTIDRRYGPAEARAFPGLSAVRGMTNGRSYSIGGRSVGVATGEIAGRPVVVYIDLAAGDNLGMVDLSRIRLAEDAAPAPPG